MIIKPGSANSAKTMPLTSKKAVSIAFLSALCLRALHGRSALVPFECHSLDVSLHSTSKTRIEVSSPVTTRSMRSSVSLSSCRLSSDHCWQQCFCSSVRILGMNLGAIFDKFKSFFRMLWMTWSFGDSQPCPRLSDVCLQ